MRLSITHRTVFSYSLPARSNINELRLAPEETDRQVPGNLHIAVLPEPETGLTHSRDLYGNLVHAFEIESKHPHLEVVASSEVETKSTESLPIQAKAVPVEDFAAVKSEDSIYEFRIDSQYIQKSPEIWREAVDVSHENSQSWGHLAEALSRHVFQTCHWTEQMIHRATTAGEVQATRQGTCQDFAHLLIGLCRALGMPARYSSGYLYDPGLESAGLEAQFIGASVSHAWVDIYTPTIGWVGIDPTNNCWVDEHYVSVARGRDYGDVAPIRGSLLGGGPKRSLDVTVDIKRH